MTMVVLNKDDNVVSVEPEKRSERRDGETAVAWS